jgi:UDP-N-acetyl-D-glucosamine dehydrogenase
LLEERGAAVEYHDPHVEIIPSTREHREYAGRRSIPLEPGRLSQFDAVLIATDHDAVDYRLIAKHAKLTIDTRNACWRAGVRGETIVKA